MDFPFAQYTIRVYIAVNSFHFCVIEEAANRFTWDDKGFGAAMNRKVEVADNIVRAELHHLLKQVEQMLELERVEASLEKIEDDIVDSSAWLRG